MRGIDDEELIEQLRAENAKLVAGYNGLLEDFIKLQEENAELQAALKNRAN